MCFVATVSCLNDYPAIKIGDYKAYLRPHATIRLDYRYSSETYQQTIKTTITPCHYGKYRHWWLCPTCGKRVGILYCKGKFICRKCIGLSYESQLIYPLLRPLLQLNAIQARLQWQNGLLSPRTKPKAMHQTTFNQLVQQHDHFLQQFIERLAMFKTSEPKPKKAPHEYTLDDIFAELDHAKFIAGIKGNAYVLVVIPIIKAKLLGLDKNSLDDIDGEKPLFNIIDVTPNDDVQPDDPKRANFDSVLDKALNDCIDLMEKVRPEKPKRNTKPKTTKKRAKS